MTDKPAVPPAVPPVAARAIDLPLRSRRSKYPEPFASRVGERDKRHLGDVFGLANFGVNLTRLAPGACSAMRHAHSRQDEFVYILSGHPVLLTDAGRTPLEPGVCAGFRAGNGNAHCLLNETAEDVLYIEIGDRTPGDTVVYPDDDLAAHMEGASFVFTRKDGTPY